MRLVIDSCFLFLLDCDSKIEGCFCSQHFIIVLITIILIQEVLPIARKLGERVLESCANKLKPYLVQAVNTLGISLDDYSNVLASICQDTSGSLEQNDVCATSEHAVSFPVFMFMII